MLSYISHSKPTIGQNDIDAVSLQLQSNLLAKGTRVTEFEFSISKANNVKFSVCTSSGSTALQIILMALNLRRNSEVIMPSYVCESVYNSIVSLGYVPVFCDIESNWITSCNSIKSKITPRTSAIILVHLYGIDAWEDSLDEVNIPIIEDFCQGFAVHTYTKRELKGVAGFCSFNATKCLTTGEGGAIITNSAEVFNRSSEIIRKKTIASNFSDFQASIGISQLTKYNNFILRRKEIANVYFDAIKEKMHTHKMNLLKSKTMFFRFLLFGEFNIEECIAKANEKGIAIRRGVDRILHKTQDSNLNEFKNTELVFKSTLSLPIYPKLNELEQMRVVNFINEI